MADFSTLALICTRWFGLFSPLVQSLLTGFRLGWRKREAWWALGKYCLSCPAHSSGRARVNSCIPQHPMVYMLTCSPPAAVPSHPSCPQLETTCELTTTPGAPSSCLPGLPKLFSLISEDLDSAHNNLRDQQSFGKRAGPRAEDDRGE